MNAHAIYSYSGANVLLVEYRGYGRSSGFPSESGTNYILNHIEMDNTLLKHYNLAHLL